jgi:uncharacterized coiled-coil protein SlyX
MKEEIVKINTVSNHQDRILAVTALSNKLIEHKAVVTALRTEMAALQSTVNALLDQNAKSKDYVEFLRAKVRAARGKQ